MAWFFLEALRRSAYVRVGECCAAATHSGCGLARDMPAGLHMQHDAMTQFDNTHHAWMALALEQAQLAAQAGEVPVGAVVVCDGQVIAKAYNQTLQLADPTAHAEVLALRQAAQTLGNHRLNECILYVTLEPCAMCSGAVFQARLKTVVYGAKEAKTGAAGSVVDLFANRQLNHHTEVIGGVLAQPSSRMLADFFAQRRAETRTHRTPQRLSDAALRTPERAFAGMAAAASYVHSLPSAFGLRMHYVQQGEPSPQAKPTAKRTVWVLLHPLWHWSAWWQPLQQALFERGERTIAPDLMGWGRSDKPKRADWHSLERHAQLVYELLVSLDVQRCVLVCQDGSEAVAQALAALSQSQTKQVEPLVDVLAVMQLQCKDTQGIWPAPLGQAKQKTWRVDAFLRAHLQAQPLMPVPHQSQEPQSSVQSLWQMAAAPYPDAGHARNWSSPCFVSDVSKPMAVPTYQWVGHAQRDAVELAQQLRIMAQAWGTTHGF